MEKTKFKSFMALGVSGVVASTIMICHATSISDSEVAMNTAITAFPIWILSIASVIGLATKNESDKLLENTGTNILNNLHKKTEEHLDTNTKFHQNKDKTFDTLKNMRNKFLTTFTKGLGKEIL